MAKRKQKTFKTQSEQLPKDSPSKENVKTRTDEEKQEESKRLTRVFVYSFFIFVACLAAGGEFAELADPAPVYPSAALTEKKRLSDYLPSLKGTRGDSEILIYQGQESGAAMLVLGGTHPNEPASNVTAVLLAENIQVDKGKVIIIHRANASAFTATEPQEAFPQSYSIENRKGQKREFQVGSRYSNILDGWPDPIVYTHYPSGQLLSGAETRNLNRVFPGRPDGTLTEKAAYAITEIVRKEKVDITIDLHEAAPEYPVINAIVAHERAIDIAAMAVVELQMRGVEIQLEESPRNFHGLSHREIGDFTNSNVVLMETTGALQGRLRGETDTDLILDSKDALYHKAHELGKLATPFPVEGIPMEIRVGRHTESIKVLTKIFSEFNPGNPIVFSHIPDYQDLLAHGVGFYLQ